MPGTAAAPLMTTSSYSWWQLLLVSYSSLFLCFFLLSTLHHASLHWSADLVYWPCIGHTDGVYWAIYWKYWVSVLGHILGWLTLCSGPSTGQTAFVYWTLYWVHWCCVLGPLLDLSCCVLGPILGILSLSTGALGFHSAFFRMSCFWCLGGWACTMTHLLSVGCVYTKSMWPAPWWQPFSINAGNFFLFLISLCFFASFF